MSDPQNSENDHRPSPKKSDDDHSKQPSDYYYNDSTGYEIYEEDEMEDEEEDYSDEQRLD